MVAIIDGTVCRVIDGRDIDCNARGHRTGSCRRKQRPCQTRKLKTRKVLTSLMLSWSSYSRGRTPFPRRTCSEIRGFPSITVLVLSRLLPSRISISCTWRLSSSQAGSSTIDARSASSGKRTLRGRMFSSTMPMTSERARRTSWRRFLLRRYLVIGELSGWFVYCFFGSYDCTHLINLSCIQVPWCITLDNSKGISRLRFGAKNSRVNGINDLPVFMHQGSLSFTKRSSGPRCGHERWRGNELNTELGARYSTR